MKMRPTVNSDEFVNVDRSAHIARYTHHSSRRPKEQISGSKNAQTEYETHLSQNAAYSSTYGPSTTPLNQQTAYRVNSTEEDQRNVTRNPEKTEQNHKGVDTRDIGSLRMHRSTSCCVGLRLCCLRLYRAKKRCCKRVLRKPRRLFERIKTRRRECRMRRVPDDAVAVAGVSNVSYRVSMSYRDAPKKSRKRRKEQDKAGEVQPDKDIGIEISEDTKDTKDTRKERKERRKRQERRKKEEKQERRERREELVSHAPMEPRLVARDDDLVVEDRDPVKPPPSIADLEKTCCYLCVQNTLAIAAATAAATVSKPEQSDKCVQVSAHKFHAETSPTLDKSCSPVVLVRTVQSSVKVRTRETGTLWCPGTSEATAVPRGETGPRVKKRKKFVLFPGLTRTKCPAGRHAACETDNAEKREPRNERRCCREKTPDTPRILRNLPRTN